MLRRVPLPMIVLYIAASTAASDEADFTPKQPEPVDYLSSGVIGARDGVHRVEHAVLGPAAAAADAPPQKEIRAEQAVADALRLKEIRAEQLSLHNILDTLAHSPRRDVHAKRRLHP